jgi:hypothetical protein
MNKEWIQDHLGGVVSVEENLLYVCYTGEVRNKGIPRQGT